MKKNLLILFSLFYLGSLSNAFGQISESVVVVDNGFAENNIVLNYKADYSQFKAPRFILPAALISYGFASRYTGLDWTDKKLQKESQRKWNTSTKIDDGLLFVPYAAVYGLDFCGVKPVNDFKDRTIVMATSATISYGLTTALKHATNRQRPDGKDKKSFPSGHTALAFSGAHILMKEYRHVSTWIGVGGYIVATSVGCFRITNNRHWFSDVVAGAGFGILGAELGYLLMPYISKAIPFGSTNKNLSLTPTFGADQAGLGLQYTF